MLKFILEDLKDGVRVPVEATYDPKALDIEFSGMSYPAMIQVKGGVEKTGNTLRFEGTLTTQVKQTCGRCLKENVQNFNEEFDWVYETGGKEFIDPEEDIRELLVLEYPALYLCKENCKGLCPVCGKDMNENPCKCPQTGYHSFPVVKKKSKREQ